MTFAHSLRMWRTVFAICLAERLTYRTDFILGTLMRFMPIVTTIFLWRAIFAGADGGRIAGFDAQGIVAYYLMTMVGRAFSSMPGLASAIAADVRTGTIKKYLTQPVDHLGFLLASRAAHKCVYYAVALPAFVAVFWACRGFFPPPPPPAVFAAVAASLVLSFLIGFAFEAWVGCWAFWLLEISSINFIVMMLVYVMSGHMFPLDLAPEPYATVMKLLPFQYLAYFPAKLYLSGADGVAAWTAVGQQALVTIWLFALLRVTHAAGLRRYSAYGG